MELCRSCGKSINPGDLVNIFSGITNENTIQVVEVLSVCCGLSIHRNDELPQTICANCKSRIWQMYSFRKQCQNVELDFKLQLNGIKTGKQLYLLPNDRNQTDRNDSINIPPESSKRKEDKQVPQEGDSFETVFFKEESNDGLYGTVAEIKIEPVLAASPDDHSYLEENCDHNERIPTPIEITKPKKSKQNNVENNKKVKVKEEDMRYECRVCVRSFGNKKILFEHISDSHPPKEQRLCKKRFYDLNRTRSKKKRKSFDSAGMRFECRVCIETFKSKTDLFNHINTHPVGEQRLCKKRFYDINRSRTKEQRTGEFICDICAKKVTTNAALRIHMRIHTGEKPYECDMCGKQFARRGNIKTHMRIHTGDRPHLCSICGNRFDTPSSLRCHQATHSDARPYSCEACGTAYRFKWSLNAHVMAYHRENGFTCDVCGREFSIKQRLVRHMYIHNGLPFCCSLCDVRCATRRLLQAHLRDIHLVSVDLTVIQKGIPVRIGSMKPLAKP